MIFKKSFISLLLAFMFAAISVNAQRITYTATNGSVSTFYSTNDAINYIRGKTGGKLIFEDAASYYLSQTIPVGANMTVSGISAASTILTTSDPSLTLIQAAGSNVVIEKLTITRTSNLSRQSVTGDGINLNACDNPIVRSCTINGHVVGVRQQRYSGTPISGTNINNCNFSWCKSFIKIDNVSGVNVSQITSNYSFTDAAFDHAYLFSNISGSNSIQTITASFNMSCGISIINSLSASSISVNSCTINNSGHQDIYVSNSKNVSISSCTIKNAGRTWNAPTSSNIVPTTGYTASGYKKDCSGIDLMSCQNTSVLSSTIEDNSFCGILISGGSGINISSNLSIKDNSKGGNNFGTYGDGGVGVYAGGVSVITFYNNKITGIKSPTSTKHQVIGILVNNSSSGVRLEANNCTNHCKGDIIVVPDSTSGISYINGTNYLSTPTALPSGHTHS